jgi:hypothetical protein
MLVEGLPHMTKHGSCNRVTSSMQSAVYLLNTALHISRGWPQKRESPPQARLHTMHGCSSCSLKRAHCTAPGAVMIPLL